MSLAAGALAGVIYWGIGVRAPSPPPVALLGLFGIGAGQAATTRVIRKLRGPSKSRDNDRSAATGREEQAEVPPRSD
jgi:XapX domain-containing protein